MGASIRWLPTSKGRSLVVQGPSKFIAAMTAAFGGPPWAIGEGEVPILRGMQAACDWNSAAFGELLEAIEKHGEVKVWAEW